jgi:uncharacterized protein YjeT (DUF2065 family)
MGFDFLLLGLGLVLIIEGILPFLAPRGWREAMFKIAQMDDRRIRFYGLTSMGVGLLLVLLMT